MNEIDWWGKDQSPFDWDEPFDGFEFDEEE